MKAKFNQESLTNRCVFVKKGKFRARLDFWVNLHVLLAKEIKIAFFLQIYSICTNLLLKATISIRSTRERCWSKCVISLYWSTNKYNIMFRKQKNKMILEVLTPREFFLFFKLLALYAFFYIYWECVINYYETDRHKMMIWINKERKKNGLSNLL